MMMDALANPMDQSDLSMNLLWNWPDIVISVVAVGPWKSILYMDLIVWTEGWGCADVR